MLISCIFVCHLGNMLRKATNTPKGLYEKFLVLFNSGIGAQFERLLEHNE